MGIAFEPTRALPNVAFRSSEWAAAEREAIWHGDWVFVTSEDAIAEPGDQLPLVIDDQPVLLLRDQDGQLVALSNLCAHRGTLLVDELTNAKRIQCPYHAWTFADDGRLLSVPFSPRGEVDRDAHCLPSYRVEAWHGLVFISLNPDVEPLATRFAAVDQLLVDAGIDDLHHWPAQYESDEWACNWKLAILNAMESYHLFHVHPETLEPYTPTKDAYYIQGSARSTATGGSVAKADDYVLVSLPPGFVGVFTMGSFVWQAVYPIAVGRCTVRTGGAFATPPPEKAGGLLSRLATQAGMAASSAFVPDFLPEDKAICERGQRGATGDFDPARLLEVERVVADFGHYLAWKLLGLEPTDVHVAEPQGAEQA
ncbi:MAG: aromatic ring-hydroxylating dioxygenase subunit alpha [Actinomycetota bacterium]